MRESIITKRKPRVALQIYLDALKRFGELSKKDLHLCCERLILLKVMTEAESNMFINHIRRANKEE
jgi:hypothetical protein